MVRLSVLRLCYHRNFPKAYVKKEMGSADDPAWERKRYRYTENRPWSSEEKNLNFPAIATNIGLKSDQLIHHPLAEWTIYRGDIVQVLVGKDRGKRAEVVQTVRERNWVFVRGMNLKYEYFGKTHDSPGQLWPKELPYDAATEVALIDPTDNTETKVEWRYSEQGEKVRVSKRTGRIIPIPVTAEESYEYKTKSTYRDAPKDTPAKILSETTYKPTAKTFEEEIMHEMGIVETRKPPRTFWY